MCRTLTRLVSLIILVGLLVLLRLVCAQHARAAAPLPPMARAAQPLTATVYAPLIASQIAPSHPFTCAGIALSLSPAQAVYRAGDAVQVFVDGMRPEDGTLAVQWARSSAFIAPGSPSLTDLTAVWSPGMGRYVAAWTLPATLPYGEPYDASPSQEFLLMLTVRSLDAVTIRCSGVPADQAAALTVTASSDCPTCRSLVVTRSDPGSNAIALEPFWNIAPGYSITYRGERLDAPQDDHGQPLGIVTFTTRMEYEAPVRLCGDTDVTPMRFTKDNTFGYWNPAAAKVADRTGSIWTDGKANLRFFLTGPGYSYPWQASLRGAYGHKIYEVTDGIFALNALSSTLNRTILHTGRTHENYYHPPYLLAYDSVPAQGAAAFARIDSLFHSLGTEDPAVICAPHPPAENHDWHARVQLLTDPQLAAEFAAIQGYLAAPGEIVVLTFFEGGDYSGHRPGLREDWYLLEGVGLAGIDQVSWPMDDSAAARMYLDAPFLRADLPTKPATRLRAQSAYLGGPLHITPFGPNTTWPLTVAAGDCYTVGIHSQSAQAIPYDGHLEVNSNPPGLWTKAVGGAPQWADNGVVTECLPADFPAGDYKVKLRPVIAAVGSAFEQSLPYTSMPWSDDELWVRVVAPSLAQPSLR